MFIATNNRLLGAPARLVAALALAVAVALALLAPASAQTATQRDFFGTVVSADATLLVIATDDGDVDVLVNDDTEVRIPSHDDASVGDLLPGDVVAVSLESQGGVLVADKIQLVPGKTRDRHVPGQVVGLTADEIRVLTPGRSETLTFLREAETEVRFHQSTDDLGIGDFVVIVARRSTRPSTSALTTTLATVSPKVPVTKATVPSMMLRPSQECSSLRLGQTQRNPSPPS